MITRLSHATIYVLNQDEALKFYTEKLGFEVRTDVKMGDFRWLTVGPKGQPNLELILYDVNQHGSTTDEAAIGHLRAALEQGALGPGAFVTNDCRGTSEELKGKGVEFIKVIDAGQLPQVTFYKPQGNLNQHPGYTDALSGDEHIADV
ncbi:MAG: VOC family protein, partial [Roseiflexaceae bacterium]